MPVPPQAPATYVPPAQPVYNWGGIYFGLNGGYGFGNSKWTSGTNSTGTFSVDGGLAGTTLGANFQSGGFVFGVEADIDWAEVSGNTSTCAAVVGLPGVTNCQTKNNWLGTARARLGYAFGRVLVYATGGGTFSDIRTATSGTGLGIGSIDNTEFGWTAGGGVEAALAQNWTVKVEYLFVDLSGGSWACAACGSPSTSVSFDENVVRAGLNYKFNVF